MKKSHAGFWVGFAVFFSAAVYSAVVFLLKEQFDLSAWVLYGSTMLAFLLFGLQAIAASRNSSNVITDTALGIITAIYFGIQLVFGGIVCMCFNDLTTKYVLVGEIILVAAYLIIAFLMYAGQSHSGAQEHNEQHGIRKIRLLENDIQVMTDEASDPDIKNALKELVEAIHYSDPITLPGLRDVEDRIAQNVAILQDELTDEAADPLARIKTLRRLVKERDRTAAILKR